MTIAIDHDDTFDRDPALWGAFIGLARANGHRVIMVTARYPNQTDGMDTAFAYFRAEDIYFSGHRLKGPFMRDQLVHVDVWIDDSPDMIQSATNLCLC